MPPQATRALALLKEAVGDLTAKSYKLESLGLFAFRVSSVLLLLGINVLLARQLGPSGFGVYSFYYTLAALLAGLGGFGLPNLTMRETARLHALSAWAELRGFWRWGLALCTIATITILLCMFAFGYILPDLLAANATVFAWSALLLALLIYIDFFSSTLFGLKRVLAAGLVHQTGRQAIFMALLLGAVFLSHGPDLTPARAMLLHCAGAAIALSAAIILMVRSRPAGTRERSQPIYRHGEWLRNTGWLGFNAVGLLFLSQSGVLFVGGLASDADTGLFRATLQLGALVIFGLQVVQLAMAQRYARMHARGDLKEFQTVVTFGARAVMLVAAPAAAVLILGGEEVLVLLFGAEYAGAADALRIVVFGKLAQAFFGPASMILNMTGHERSAVRAMAVALTVHVSANLLLVPLAGIEGGAVALAVSLTVWSALLARLVKLRLNVTTPALALPGFR